MHPADTLERYLLDSRQIDALAARQARLVCRGVAAEELRQDARLAILLCLAALRKGSPRPPRRFLLAPLENAVLESHVEAYHEEHGAPPVWKDFFADPSPRRYIESVLSTLIEDPARFGPVCGAVPRAEAEAAAWPLLVTDSVTESVGFSRYWQAALSLERAVAQRLAMPFVPLDTVSVRATLKRVFAHQTFLPDPQQRFHLRQIAAAVLALRNRFLVVSGGPGTGKTSVVLQILRTLVGADENLEPHRIVLCAPTGRAKARLGESVDRGLETLEQRWGDSLPIRERALRESQRRTVYSLLAFGPDGRPRYNRQAPLPSQVIVVDEASMVDICSFAALLDAAAPECRIILCGDMHQLPSVEAGAVLGDLTERFAGLAVNGYPTCTTACAQWVADVTEGIALEEAGVSAMSLACAGDDALARAGTLADRTVILTRSYRSVQDIMAVSAQVNAGDPAKAQKLIESCRSRGTVVLEDGDIGETVRRWLEENLDRETVGVLEELRNMDRPAVERPDTMARIARILGRSCILTLAHHGPSGRQALNRMADELLRPQLDSGALGRFFHGQPVILGLNHHDLELYNGDLGIVVRTRDGGMRAVFPRGTTGGSAVPLERLAAVEAAFAMTVHKAQGSEFDRVLLVLPQYPTPLLTRQILYTALTRARRHVRILGTAGMFVRGIMAEENRPGGVVIR